MIKVGVRVTGGVPLVQLSGTVTERNGAQVAAAVMSAICFATEENDQCWHPLSLVAQCVQT